MDRARQAALVALRPAETTTFQAAKAATAAAPSLRSSGRPAAMAFMAVVALLAAALLPAALAPPIRARAAEPPAQLVPSLAHLREGLEGMCES
jgi:hypothetical protein